MRFRTWLESPMGYYGWDIDHSGGPPEEKWDNKGIAANNLGAFVQRDRKLITKPAIAQQLERILNKSGYTFNVLFIESWAADQGNYQRIVAEYLRDKQIPTQGRITYVKNGSSGDPLSPWMILHTMGHAVMQDTRPLWNVLEQFYREHIRSYTSVPEEIDKDFDSEHQRVATFVSRFLAFRSARVKGQNALVISELCYELFAEYMWNGGFIRFNKPTDGRVVPFSRELMPRAAVKINDSTINIVRRHIEEVLATYLKNCVGKVVYDFYRE